MMLIIGFRSRLTEDADTAERGANRDAYSP
jgi:hypothetical protein